MEFESKHDIEDELYFMYGQLPVKSIVTGIFGFKGEARYANGEFREAKEQSIAYHFKDVSRNIPEGEVFETKEDLIDSLFDNLK